MSIDIVSDALNYYDTNNEKYKQYTKKIVYVKNAEKTNNNIEGLILSFYDENKKLLFTSRIEILGKYYTNLKIWIWGWSVPYYDKSLTSIIRKVFLYGTDITVKDKYENALLKNELVTSRFRITDEVQLDIHCAIASYLSKKPFLLRLKNIPLNLLDYSDIKNDIVDDVIQSDDTEIIYHMFIIDPPNL